MKATLLAAAATARVMNQNEFEFIQYIAKHNKSYATVEEFNSRMENYMAIDAEILRLNSEQTSSRHGHNKFSDWTREEYRGMLGLRNKNPYKDLDSTMQVTGSTNAATVDWAAAGNVEPV